MKEQNEELKTEVAYLRRSCSPDPYAKRSQTSLGDGSRRTSEISPQRSEQGRSRENLRKSPLEKKVTFRDDCMTERMKHELEYGDNTIF